MKSAREAALEFAARAFFPIPVPYKEKGPTLPDWQQLELTTPALVEQYFNGGTQNIGLILGKPYNLADVDVDSREAQWAYEQFALETDWVHGRRSKPASHFFYFPDPAVRTAKYLDPAAAEGTQACLIELRALASNGRAGLQTIVPGSIHPSGEPIEFARGHSGVPGKCDGGELERAVRWSAGSALLGRYAPATGARHEYFLAIAGALAHNKWAIEQARKVLYAVYRILWGAKADLTSADKELDSTYQRYDDGHEIAGLPHLAQALDMRVFRAVTKWLGLERAKAQAAAAAADRPARPWTLHVNPVLQDLHLERPKMLIDGVLPEAGASLLCGMQKSGKTLLAAQMMISVATGTALFQYYQVCRPGGVLVLEQDDPSGAASFQEILLKTQVPRSAPFYFVEKQDLSIGSAFIERLEKEIRDRKLVMVVLDSYTALRAGRGSGSDIVKLENAEMTLLDELGKRTRCLILLLHHDSKGSMGLDWSAKAGGSYAMTMAVESQVQIARFNELGVGSRERLVRLLGRHIEGREMALRFDPETLSYSHILEGPGAPLYPFIRDVSLDFPDARRFTIKELCDTSGIARATAYRHMATLVRAGIIQKQKGDGGVKYWLPPLERKVN